MSNNKSKSNDKFNKERSGYNDRAGNKRSRNGNYSKKENASNNSRGSYDNCSYDHNDITWFFRSPQLLRDCSSLPFSWRLGDNFRYWGADGPTRADDPNGTYNYPNWQISSVARIEMTPVVGSTDKSNASPLNMVARDLYNYIRKSNSGSRNYDAPDLMIYLMSLDSVYALWAHMTRIYGTATHFNMRNVTVPTTLFKAMGLTDADEYLMTGAWMPEFRKAINILAHQLNMFAVPSTINLYRRHIFLSQNILADGDSARCQYYVPVFSGFYKYDEYNATTGGRAVLQARPDTIQGYIDLAAQLVAGLANSEDVGIIGGDIIKAFGNNLFKIPEMGDDYVTPLVYDPAILIQLENSTIVGSLGSCEIRQTVGGLANNTALYQYFGGNALEFHAPKRTYLNLYSDDPQPADIAYCSRLIAVRGDDDNFYFGCEIVNNIVIWSGDFDNMTVTKIDKNYYVHESAATVGQYALYHMVKNNFRHFPHLEYAIVNSEGEFATGYLSSDLYNARPVNSDFIKDASIAAWYGLLGGPYSSNM